jgi:adenylate cyclase
MRWLHPVTARRRIEIPEGRGGLHTRTAIAAAAVLYALIRFGWYAGVVTLVVATVFVLLDWLQYPAGSRRLLVVHCLLISVQVAIIFAVFLAPRPFGFASDMPAPMLMKTPFLVLLLCFMVSHMSAARPPVTVWAALSVVGGFLVARMVIRADPLTITAANLVLSHYKTYLELARAAGQPHFFNNGVFGIHLRQLLIFAAILVFASYRIHFLALRTARQSALRDALGSHFSPQIAELMARSRKLGLMRWAKDLAVLDCDVVGFTALAEKSAPERVAEVLQAYRNLVAEAVFRAEGAIISYSGDGVTAAFGLTESGTPEAIAALGCAEEIVTRWYETGGGLLGDEAPAVAVGVDFGPVRAGLVGEGRALSLLILGAPVEGAAELQAMTREVSTCILLSDSAKRIATTHDPALATKLRQVELRGTTAWSLSDG